MTDTALRFNVFWTGSNKQIALDLVVCHTRKNASKSAVKLQRQVATLVNVKLHKSIKVTLGSPAGPQLTPVLRSLDMPLKLDEVALGQKPEDTQLHKAMVAAWSELQPNQVTKVFVTQHNPTAVAVDQLLSASSQVKGCTIFYDLPQSLACNSLVTLAAIKLTGGLITTPNELQGNKRFAILCMRQGKCLRTALLYSFAFAALNDDEDVVLAAVARHPQELSFASQRLKASKAFILKAIGVNGLCIKWTVVELQQDKEVALAAVRQNRAAIKYLCAELIEDKDIQQACTSNSES